MVTGSILTLQQYTMTLLQGPERSCFAHPKVYKYVQLVQLHFKGAFRFLSIYHSFYTKVIMSNCRCIKIKILFSKRFHPIVYDIVPETYWCNTAHYSCCNLPFNDKDVYFLGYKFSPLWSKPNCFVNFKYVSRYYFELTRSMLL